MKERIELVFVNPGMVRIRRITDEPAAAAPAQVPFGLPPTR